MAQHWRDSRIAPIYEGTNGVQAIDLVSRKLPLGGGAVLDGLLAQVEIDAGDTPALAAVRRATATMHRALADGRVNDALGGATPYLRTLGVVLGDWFLQRGAAAAQCLLAAGDGNAVYLKERIAVADFYRRRLLPTVIGLESAATTGCADLLAMRF